MKEFKFIYATFLKIVIQYPTSNSLMYIPTQSSFWIICLNLKVYDYDIYFSILLFHSYIIKCYAAHHIILSVWPYFTHIQ